MSYDDVGAFTAEEILESQGTAVIVTDVNGVVAYWNRAAQELYGWTTKEAVGRTIEDLLGPGRGQRAGVRRHEGPPRRRVLVRRFPGPEQGGHRLPGHGDRHRHLPRRRPDRRRRRLHYPRQVPRAAAGALHRRGFDPPVRRDRLVGESRAQAAVRLGGLDRRHQRGAAAAPRRATGTGGVHGAGRRAARSAPAARDKAADRDRVGLGGGRADQPARRPRHPRRGLQPAPQPAPRGPRDRGDCAWNS